MAATASIKVTKSFLYKGSTRQFSNRYHLDATPDSTAHWTTISDLIVTAEKAIYTSNVTIVATTGYEPGTDLPIFSKTYSTAGTYTATGGRDAPGDCAAVIRYSTTQRTSKNHPIYLFNYYHGVCRSDTATAAQFNDILATQKTAYQTYADFWLAGISDTVTTYHRAGPNGAVAQSRFVKTTFSHRDFP